MKAFLILEDGTVFEGTHIGADKEIISEIVFNTSMAGYLEVLTDPSYALDFLEVKNMLTVQTGIL